MSATRYEAWIGKTSKRKVSGAPKLKSYTANIRSIRAKCEADTFPSICMESSFRKIPSTQTNFGWEKDEASRSLLPVTKSEGVALAPMDALKLIRCGCATDQSCANFCQVHVWNCSNMSCTILCGCHGMEECCNIWKTKFSATEEDVDSDSDDVDPCDD